MAGRKTVCTPELTNRICDLIISGLSNKDAIHMAGIAQATFYDWIARGDRELARVSEGTGRKKIRKKEQPFVEFSEKIKSAVPIRKQRLLEHIQKSAAGGREYTEIKEYRDQDGNVTEKVVTTKEELPSWQAAAWLLERMHFDEFGKRQRVDSYTWRDRVVEALEDGRITPEQVKERFSTDVAEQFFAEAGLSISEVANTIE